VVITFSISELACASNNGSVLMSTAWFGINSPAPFNSANAARARMHRFRIVLVSKSPFGGRDGSELNGLCGRQRRDDFAVFALPAIAEAYVIQFNRSKECVKKQQHC
jgi:hypothetical protein